MKREEEDQGEEREVHTIMRKEREGTFRFQDLVLALAPLREDGMIEMEDGMIEMEEGMIETEEGTGEVHAQGDK